MVEQFEIINVYSYFEKLLSSDGELRYVCILGFSMQCELIVLSTLNDVP